LLNLSFKGVCIAVTSIVVLVLVLVVLTMDVIVRVGLEVDRTLLGMVIVTKLHLGFLHVLVDGLLLLLVLDVVLLMRGH
jgi:hypothetical protein